MSARFLALDLGAESGRAILGRLDGDVLTLKDVRRFPNVSVRTNGSLHWDILRLWHEVQKSLEDVTDVSLASVGLDTWGCDYALLGERGQLLENPYHYRDTRTDGVQPQVFRQVSAERIYAITGIQFLNFNSLFQLYSVKQSTPQLLRAATAFVTIPDLLNYWLTGTPGVRVHHRDDDADGGRGAAIVGDAHALRISACRRTCSSRWSSQARSSAAIRHERLGVAGRHAGGRAGVSRHRIGVRVGVHGGGGAFLSSGTWSLFGAEVAAPVISAKARELNFTNEGGVNGTTRLLKNIAGLWLLQACMRRWTEAGQPVSYDDLLVAARDDRLAFRAVFDPDHSSFFNPPDMPAAIAAYCRADRIRSSPPGSPAMRARFSRASRSSIASFSNRSRS